MAAYASQVAIVLPVGLEIGFYSDFLLFSRD
jgi:hypothetical protein